MKLEELIAQDYELTGSQRWLHGVEHDSLVVDVEKQSFYWNSKGISGDAYTWLTQIKGFSYDEAKKYLRENDDNNLYSFITFVQNKEEQVVYPKLVDIFHQESLINKEYLEYWYNRGINDTTIARYKLGYHSGWNLIPFYQDGLFRNFQMRKDNPKTIRSYYKEVGRLLFNSDILKITNTIYIAEGPTDCLRLIQEGWPVISHNAGSEGWMPEWFKYFIYQKQIYVLYDNDLAGRTGAKKVAKNLGIYRTKIYTFNGFDDKYDIVDFFKDKNTATDLSNLITTQARYSFEI